MTVREILLELWEYHAGKILGVLAGLIFGILILVFGFWRSLFVALCAIFGYLIGRRFDDKGTLRDWYERVFQGR
ncbi:MAG: DUF2273 domain-containing protein [Syntrophomonadaceae bacterium]|nr:DUF2273 domain-containing protein [Syntrophomonadaceae bacterium]